MLYETAMLQPQGSVAGTTTDQRVTPDVRAPLVRGRWHFWAAFLGLGGSIRNEAGPDKSATGRVRGAVVAIEQAHAVPIGLRRCEARFTGDAIDDHVGRGA